jgi:hypothetical protein
MMTPNTNDLTEALVCAFGLVPCEIHASMGDARCFETSVGRRGMLISRSGTLSLRHGDGWTLVVSTDERGRPMRAEITGQYLTLSAIHHLRAADQRVGGLLWDALGCGRHVHTRHAVKLLQSMSSAA